MPAPYLPFDPYFQAALANPPLELPKNGAIRLLVELKKGVTPSSAKRIFKETLGDPRNARYLTVTCKPQDLEPNAGLYKLLVRYATRVEWSCPVVPIRRKRLRQGSFFIQDWDEVNANKDAEALASKGMLERKQPTSTTLIGIIDDGCPFAHATLRGKNGTTSRVAALWDQNAQQGAAATCSQPGKPGVFGTPVKDFGYGIEYLRKPPDETSYSKLMGDIGLASESRVPVSIDDWIGEHALNGIVDEDACYGDMAYGTLARATSHGAHVLDVAAGRIASSARFDRYADERHIPPTWTPAGDENDIVFVQIPQGGIDDASGRWLDAHVLDAVAYILSRAGQDTKHIVINLSYGPTTGPHDGVSVLERALRDMTRYYDGANGRPRLQIVISAGNTYRSASHVYLGGKAGQKKHWIWRIPPDNTVPVYVEIWHNCVAQSKPPIIELKDPSGNSVKRRYERTWKDSRCTLFMLKPTVISERNPDPAPHGVYRFEVDFQEKGDIDAFIARSDPNMGARTGAKRTWFVDPEWESAHAAAAQHDRSEAGFQLSAVARRGTLNGIGTGSLSVTRKGNCQPTRVYVAGGYRLIDGKKAPYASVGPARPGSVVPSPGTSFQSRAGPDYALPTDETWALKGIRAAGNRSGGTFRMIGTSTAAPQLARLLARAGHRNVCQHPPAPDEAFGYGKLDPP